jgi:hypothetical protein
MAVHEYSIALPDQEKVQLFYGNISKNKGFLSSYLLNTTAVSI